MGTITTFYSYKGGTGRSMSLANVAWILATNGYRVLMVDWDLEAPGLHRYVAPFLSDPDLSSTPGLIDLMWHVIEAAHGHDELNLEPGKEWFRPLADEVVDYVCSLRAELPRQARLDLLGAGRQGAAYAARVNGFDWTKFYRLGGGRFLRLVADELRRLYDFVLIDSRTGVSDTSGICTVEMPDQLVVCFTLNNQSILGASDAAQSARQQRASSMARPNQPDDRRLPFRVLPVPTRVEDGEEHKRKAALGLAYRRFDSLLDWLPSERRQSYWGAVELKYKKFYAYHEILAPFVESSTELGSVLASCERLTSFLTDGMVARTGEIATQFRDSICTTFEATQSLRPEGTSGRDGNYQTVHERLLAREQVRVMVQRWEALGKPVEDLVPKLLDDLATTPIDDAHESVRGFVDAVSEYRRGLQVTARTRQLGLRYGLFAVALALVLALGASMFAAQNARVVAETRAELAAAAAASAKAAKVRADLAEKVSRGAEERLATGRAAVQSSQLEAQTALEAARSAREDAKVKSQQVRDLEREALRARARYEAARKDQQTLSKAVDQARADAVTATSQLNAIAAQQVNVAAEQDTLRQLLATADAERAALRAQLAESQQQLAELRSQLNASSANAETLQGALDKVEDRLPMDASPL